MSGFWVCCVLQSDEEQRVVSEILNVLVCLGPERHEIIVELLTLLAHKELGLQ